MAKRENGSGTLRELNNSRKKEIWEMVRNMGTNATARELGVNPKFVSELVNHDKLPGSMKIAKQMGFSIRTLYRSAPHGATYKSTRAIAHANTNPKKIAADLLAATGDVWVRLEEEMEY